MTKSLALALAIWTNSPDGAQHEFARVTMPARACLALQAAIWRVPFPTIGRDAMGDIPAIDAACLPELEQ